MNDMEEIKIPRKQIFIRLLYTVMYLIVFEILKFFVLVSVIFQYIYLLITQTYSVPLRNFSNKVATYAYQLLRYLTLNENYRPFPFNDFPAESESPVDFVKFE